MDLWSLGQPVCLEGKGVLSVQRRGWNCPLFSSPGGLELLPQGCIRVPRHPPLTSPRPGFQTQDSVWPVSPRWAQRHPCQCGFAQPQGSAYNPLLPYLFPPSFSFPLTGAPSPIFCWKTKSSSWCSWSHISMPPVPTSHPLPTVTSWYF